MLLGHKNHVGLNPNLLTAWEAINAWCQTMVKKSKDMRILATHSCLIMMACKFINLCTQQLVNGGDYREGDRFIVRLWCRRRERLPKKPIIHAGAYKQAKADGTTAVGMRRSINPVAHTLHPVATISVYVRSALRDNRKVQEERQKACPLLFFVHTRLRVFTCNEVLRGLGRERNVYDDLSCGKEELKPQFILFTNRRDTLVSHKTC